MSSRIWLAEDPQALEQEVPLAPQAEAALALWQARVGEVLTVCSPRGGYFRARLLPAARSVRPFQRLSPLLEPPQRRRLCQALPDKERMLWIVQKAVELGATQIQPLVSRASSAGPGEPGFTPRQDKSATWARVALEAAKQCRRAVLPTVASPQTLGAFLQHNQGEAMLFLDVEGEREGLRQAAQRMQNRPLSLLVGPEGGWRDEERAAALAAGCCPVHLGQRVLRTETAALAGLAMLVELESPSA